MVAALQYQHAIPRSIQFGRSVVSDSLQPHGLQHASLPCPSLSHSLLKFMFVESLLLSNQSHPLPLSSPPAFNLSQHQGLFRWPRYWSFSFSISPSNEYSGLIFFRIDWFGLLAVQGTLKNLVQPHSSKASILWCSVFFIVQLSHPYTTTRKNHSFD